MGEMAKIRERDSQLKSILASRQRELGIEAGRVGLGRELASHYDLDLGRGRGRASTALHNSCMPIIFSFLWIRQIQKQPGAAMRAPDSIIRLKTVLARTALSRATIYRKIADGSFPPQIRISAHGTGWRESDINRWVADPTAWRPGNRARL